MSECMSNQMVLKHQQVQKLQRRLTNIVANSNTMTKAQIRRMVIGLAELGYEIVGWEEKTNLH